MATKESVLTKLATATEEAQALPDATVYPYTVPSYQELAFSDQPEVDGQYATGATWKNQDVVRTPVDLPGFYYRDDNAPVRWKNIGGDWIDAAGTPQGTVPIATATIPDLGAAVGQWVSVDVLPFVSKWVSGEWQNYGIFMRAGNAGSIIWASRFSSTPPELVLVSASAGQLTIPCGRSIGLQSGSYATTAGRATMETAGSIKYSLLWFDLSSVPNDITAATLRLYSTDQYGQQVLHLFRISNPSDQTVLPPVAMGLAAGYPAHAGIENDASVIFHQPFADANYGDLWMHATPNAVNNPLGDRSRGLVTPAMAAAEGNGFTPLAGTFNAIKCQNIPGGDNASLEACWSPWSGYGQRLKPPEEVEEIYLQFHVLLGDDWNPGPAGGKFPGLDNRYCTLTGELSKGTRTYRLGMGRGNSGSGADGFSGSSARLNYSRFATPGSPLEHLRGLGSGDMYDLECTIYGHNIGWGNNYLAQLRKGVWHCIELYARCNDVTNPDARPRQLASLTQAGGIATATLVHPETSPEYVTGARWSVGGVGLYSGYYDNQYQGTKVITVLSPTQFTYSCHPNTPAVGSAYIAKDGNAVWLSCAPSEAIPNGIVRGWVNGRLAGEATNLRWRHVRYRPDGGIFGIDALWFCCYQGGGKLPTTTNTAYFSEFIAAKRYIGPMVV